MDKELNVQLQFSGNPLPLPYWFVRGTNAKLSRFGMLINLAPYIRNVSEQNPYSLIEELEKRRNYEPKTHPPFSSEMIRYALLGPLLFNIFINDMFYFIKDTNIANYADDSTLYTVEGNIDDLLNTLENETSLILDWFRINEMKPNDDKCHLIVTNKDFL